MKLNDPPRCEKCGKVRPLCPDDICKECHSERSWVSCWKYHLYCYRCANYTEKCNEIENLFDIKKAQRIHFLFMNVPFQEWFSLIDKGKKLTNCSFIDMDIPEDLKDMYNTKWIKMEWDGSQHSIPFHMELRDYFNKIISGAIKISFKENIEPYRRMYDHKVYIKCKTCNKIIYPSKTQYCSKPCEVIGEL